MAAVDNQRPLSTTLKVVDIEGKGRGLVATRSLKAGEVVLQDSPILIYSASPLKRKPSHGGYLSSFRYCAHCVMTLDSDNKVSSSMVFRCSSCFHPEDGVFCSQKCQLLALTLTHTTWVCQALSYLRSCSLLDRQPEELQVEARFLVAAYNLAMVSPSNFQVLLSLEGDAAVDASPSIFLHSLISALPFPQGSLTPSLQMTSALLTKDKLNAFGLMEPFSGTKERSVRAYAIYHIASFFNHDCLPNACRFDYVDTVSDNNRDIIVRMIHDVPEGREICLSYFPVNLTYPERQRRLRNDCGFTCFCDRCKVEVNWSNDQDDEDKDEAMEEDEEEGEQRDMSGSEEEFDEVEHGRDDDFPHAYFFLRYMCDEENCGGTLAPLPPSGRAVSQYMECNVCGKLKKDEIEHES